MTSSRVGDAPVRRPWLSTVNTDGHRIALNLFLLVVVAHWAEHISQAYQLWALNWAPAQARGVLGIPFPWLIRSEWLHYGYALVMVIGLLLLRRGFTGRSRAWWTAALAIQFWHHIEHLLLLIQAQTGWHLGGKAVPMSLLQLVVPRVELHLFYNTVVFVPMVVAMYLHLRPSRAEAEAARCTCGPAVAPR